MFNPEARWDRNLPIQDCECLNEKIEVLYENLSRDYVKEMKRVQKFLDVEHEFLRPLTQKRSNQPLSKEIKNYFELKEQFKETPWSEFFED